MTSTLHRIGSPNWWWVDSIQVKSECRLPSIAQSPYVSAVFASLSVFSFLGTATVFPSVIPVADLACRVGRVTHPCKISPQPPPELEVGVGVEPLGTDESLAMTPILFC
ncbi:hypothetical protein E2C01_032973 [Portunus trituberculatus]|uniref:Uncharacterized protein n=1 Tax=Portunus trituberculatus TaxID=210409 RepID=A0A5B7F1S3_PORTR|nr:hypothetical protein [Portunus trituberculatus]